MITRTLVEFEAVEILCVVALIEEKLADYEKLANSTLVEAETLVLKHLRDRLGRLPVRINS